MTHTFNESSRKKDFYHLKYSKLEHVKAHQMFILVIIIQIKDFVNLRPWFKDKKVGPERSNRNIDLSYI